MEFKYIILQEFGFVFRCLCKYVFVQSVTFRHNSMTTKQNKTTLTTSATINTTDTTTINTTATTTSFN